MSGNSLMILFMAYFVYDGFLWVWSESLIGCVRVDDAFCGSFSMDNLVVVSQSHVGILCCYVHTWSYPMIGSSVDA